ncbi:T9SS type A sorting domain-containing protein [Hymenobacter canadensis]|uniref:T9SS type A sorting domain-containing protein n=1 Tax=Hymenobacter canadensis TaxID=2999067 RepID=A0ABY7LUP8_9BACT|nr:T9SS type A sorting domain-containing protein [Hymenobacter canadensis]WBA44118.1 T9SS type A sorting domain-containing protein [Hymenobacter canadensis]
MEKLLSGLLLAFSLGSSGPASAQLTVRGGYGSGTYAPADTAYVLANPTPAGQVFDRWLATPAAVLSDTFAVATRVRPPVPTATLTPVYRAAPAWTPVFQRFNGSNLYYHFPRPAAQLRGIISFHHGASGNATGWFTRPENRTFLDYAVAAGYAVFATESTDRLSNPAAPKQWSNAGTVAANPDVQNIQGILASFRTQGLITAATPVLGVGFSQGSGFTSIIAGLLGFRANVLGATPGLVPAITATLSPTYWMASRRDTLEDPQRLQRCVSNFQLLRGRGIAARLMIHEPFPVTPNRFRRIAGIDSTMSADIYTRLKTAGLLDARDFLTFNPRTASPWQALLPVAYQPFFDDIDDQLFICFTEHKFHSDLVHDIVRFFNRFAAPIVTATQGAAPANTAVTLFPNPAAASFTYAAAASVSRLTVYDDLGRLVLTAAGNGSSGRVDIRPLPAGLYLLRLQTAAGFLPSFRFLKE